MYMTTAASAAVGLAVVLALALLLLVIRKNSELGDQIDSRIHAALIIVCGSIAGLGIIYGLVRFVRWAWLN
jgi:membrane protein YdbS with pleckstrin-like domain